MSETEKLKLPFIEAAQAQKHVTHNEALLALDTLVQASVADRDLTVPPASPANGDTYIVASGATGEWAGWDDSVVIFQDGLWRQFEPNEGWIVWVEDENLHVRYATGAWAQLQALTTGVIAELGVNTTADSVNRLSVSSDAVLLSHAGSGIQAKLNKNTAGDTASLLMQTGFSGRAEMGLTGDDDFHFKVSPDGGSWFEALKISRADGAVTADNGISTKYLNGGQLAGFRNNVINGDFRVWQRGTSETLTNTRTYLADRWESYYGGARTCGRQSGDQAQYCIRSQRNSGETDLSAVNLSQSLETVNSIPLAGKQATLSFRARKGANFSAASDIFKSRISTGTGTDQSRLGSGYLGGIDQDQDNVLTAGWQTFSQHLTLDGDTNEIAVTFLYSPTGTAGSDDWFEIELIQLEIGIHATPFELRPFFLELTMCNWYAQKVGWATGQRITTGTHVGSSTMYGPLSFSEMRVTPSVLNAPAASSYNIHAHDTTTTPSSVTVTPLSLSGGRFTVSYGGGSAGESATLYADASVSMILSAEL